MQGFCYKIYFLMDNIEGCLVLDTRYLMLDT